MWYENLTGLEVGFSAFIRLMRLCLVGNAVFLFITFFKLKFYFYYYYFY